MPVVLVEKGLNCVLGVVSETASKAIMGNNFHGNKRSLMLFMSG